MKLIRQQDASGERLVFEGLRIGRWFVWERGTGANVFIKVNEDTYLNVRSGISYPAGPKDRSHGVQLVDGEIHWRIVDDPRR